MHEAERKALVSALLKVLGFAAVLGLVLGLGLFLVFRGSGLTSDASEQSTRATSVPSLLPTTALPDPDQPSPSASASASDEPSESPSPNQITLEMSPNPAAPGARVDLSGPAPGVAEGSALQVQRKDPNGNWVSFANITASVRGGQFGSYIYTDQVGVHEFRMVDSGTGRASNVVKLTIQ